jgi:alpha-galactosidase
VIKIAMIGAGSVVFSKNLTGDILSCAELAGSTIAYMDIDGDRLDVAVRLAHKLADRLHVTPAISGTTDRRAALAGADFVINMVQIGGYDSTLIDFDIPRKYGLNFTIADTTGPGGLFRGLRTAPFLIELCRDMAEVCPRAWLLNYANPMSMNMRVIAHCGQTRAVGLCHSVQGTINNLAWLLGLNAAEIAFVCAGINHMAFYLRLEHGGADLYPRLAELAGRYDAYNTNKVRFELFKRLGYYPTESSEHHAEYSSHFMPHGPDLIARLDIPIDEYLRRCRQFAQEFEQLRHMAHSDQSVEVNRTQEYAMPIMRAMVTGQSAVVYGNMVNQGAITNLPADAIAETAALVDNTGIRLTTAGDLPPQIAGYIQPHVIQHELFMRAIIEKNRERIYQAVMNDPLTAAMVPLDGIVQMCDEMIERHGLSL